MGFPPQFFTVLFAIPRVTGYLSHWREQLTDPDVKIARPQQNYTVCSRPCAQASTCSASELLSISALQSPFNKRVTLQSVSVAD